MTPPIERIRYYDGEYLRAFDFAAEQGYHVDMRRRLNMALHLYGIVEGLQLTPSRNAGITQVSINPGMAIDPYGREIFLLAPYTFDDQADVLANHITSSGNYQVWIQYSRIADTPPSVGYASCNQTDQTTRWRETCKVVLLKSSGTPDIPAVTDDISEEDPDTDTSNGVFLGFVTVTPNSLTGAFNLPPTQPAQPAPVYIGLRAQSIVCPVQPTGFNILNQQDALDPPASLDLQSNVFIDQNLIVGDDFTVDPTKIQPAPTGTFPNLTGNVKVTGDLFLNGNLYTTSGDQWLTLQQQIQNSVPDIQFWTQTFSPQATGTDPSTGTVPATVTSKLKAVSSASAQAILFGIEWLDAVSLKTWFNDLPPNPNSMPVQVNAGAATPVAPGSSTYNIPINWTVGPVATVSLVKELGLKSISVGLIVVFLP